VYTDNDKHGVKRDEKKIHFQIAVTLMIVKEYIESVPCFCMG